MEWYTCRVPGSVRAASWVAWSPVSSCTSTPSSASCSWMRVRSEEHTSELQSRGHLVCRLLLEKKKSKKQAKMQRSVSRSERYKKKELSRLSQRVVRIE